MSLISVLSESAQTKRGKGGGEGCLLGGGGKGKLISNFGLYERHSFEGSAYWGEGVNK